jgi:ABC-type multidrug transport system fused ATPase/permease subunit
VNQPKGHLRYLRECFRGYGPRIAATLLFLALARAAATADPLYLKKIIDAIGHGQTGAVLRSGVLVYFGLKVGTFVFELLRDVIFAPVEVGVGRRVSESVFDYLLRLPVSYQAEQKTGGLARKIARGSRAITWIQDFLVVNDCRLKATALTWETTGTFPGAHHFPVSLASLRVALGRYPKIPALSRTG